MASQASTGLEYDLKDWNQIFRTWKNYFEFKPESSIWVSSSHSSIKSKLCFFVLGPQPGISQELLLALHPRITPVRLRDHLGCPGLNPRWLSARKILSFCPLYTLKADAQNHRTLWLKGNLRNISLMEPQDVRVPHPILQLSHIAMFKIANSVSGKMQEGKDSEKKKRWASFREILCFAKF